MYINTNYIVFVFLFVCIEFSFASFLQLKEGDQCDTNKLHKTCQRIKNCPLVAEKIKKGSTSDICGMGRNKEEQLVCCGKTLKKDYGNKKYHLEKEEKHLEKKKIIKRAVKKPGEISKKMCEEYAKHVISVEDSPILLPGAPQVKVDNCGILETPLIVGGELAKPKEFPHMVLVGHNDENDDIIYWQCGGSLISDQWVLSAAHCTATKRGLAGWATLGDLKILSNDDEDGSRPVTLRIVQRINHPQYEASKGYHDIALYKLEKPVEFNAYVRPICLNTNNNPIGGKAIASGWGNTKFRGSSSQDLMKVILNFKDMKECDNLFKSSANQKLLAKIPNGITNNLVCAWEQGKDTCQGDSGGPLQVRLNSTYCMYAIVGITSFGEDCATKLPGVYTRVSYYVPWIESIVWS